MHARSTTIQADPGAIDAGIAHVRDEAMPTILGIEGCVGLSILVHRQSGRCIATSAWRSAGAMRASNEQVRPIRNRSAEILGGRAQVDEWEIAVLHRDHRTSDGAAVRSTWTLVAPDNLDRALGLFRSSSLPAIEELEGFCSASVLVNRESGRSVLSVTYDSREAMERNREQASSVRIAGIQDSVLRLLDVREFELAIAHLHAPEMA